MIQRAAPGGLHRALLTQVATLWPIAEMTDGRCLVSDRPSSSRFRL
ncbi:MAG TPA: hypothetical protein VNO30_01070 [Kofleriaceae bacterium]|nr:hypothetical protein [Kofleriaceae bacterium]